MSPVRPTVELVGTRRDPDAHRVRDFLTRMAQPHELLKEGSPEADDALAATETRLLKAHFPDIKRDAPGKNRTCARGLGNRCSIH